MYKRFSKMLLSLLIAFVTVFSLWSPSIDAAANDLQITDSDELTNFSKKSYLKVNDDGKTESVSKKELERLKEQAKDEFEKNKKTDLFNDQPVKPESILESEKESEPNAVSYVEITDNITLDYDNDSIVLESTITDLVGTNPLIIITGHHLYNGKASFGSFSQVTGYDIEWTGAEIYIGQSHSKEYEVSETNYWMTSSTTVAGWIGSGTKTSSSEYGPFLTNKNAEIYPVIQNEHSGESMPLPDRADYTFLDPGDRTPRDPDLRNQYIRQYIDTYGDPQWNWSLLDVHHVRPLSYGGGNNFENLFAMPREMHQQIVTPWWTNY